MAAVGNTAMLTGAYPVLPHVGVYLTRQCKQIPVPPRQLRAVAREWVVAAAVSAARPIGFLGLPVALRYPRGPRPIILLHGYAMNRASFLLLARRLVSAGLGPVYGFEYWTLGQTSRAARRLGRYVERVCEATGSPRVDLIGHSLGGVVSRYLVTLDRGHERVRNLVTIGSPHRGANMSGFGIGHPHKELYPGSALLERLESAVLPAETRITTIWSRSDALVPGARDARLHGVEEIVYDDLGHLSLLASRRVANDIIARLSWPD